MVENDPLEGISRIRERLNEVLDNANPDELKLRTLENSPSEVRERVNQLLDEAEQHLENSNYNKARESFSSLMNYRGDLEAINEDFSWGTDEVMDNWYMETNTRIMNQR